MVYIDSIKGSSIALIIFIVATILVPLQIESKGIELILTVSTFLFAIIAGLYLTRMNSKYDQIRELIADEDALWLSFYKSATMCGKKFSKEVSELIDKYYIAVYDFSEKNDYYRQTSKHFLGIYDEIRKTTKGKVEGVFQWLLELLSSIEENRNKTSVLGLERVGKGQWSVLIILAGIVVFSVFYIRTPDLFSQITTVLL